MKFTYFVISEANMDFQAGFLYHIYNQANADFRLFKEERDYELFLGKLGKWVRPKCDILAYCLMPNHYHLMVSANDLSVEKVKLGSIQMNALSNGMRILQSQYAQEFNEKYHSRGSLFRPRAKAKLLDDSGHHALNCFHYILQNPVKARLCRDPFEWKYSSAIETESNKENSIITPPLLKQHIDLDWANFREEIKRINDDERDIWTL